MTPQATKLYFELLDEQTEKLAGVTGAALGAIAKGALGTVPDLYRPGWFKRLTAAGKAQEAMYQQLLPQHIAQKQEYAVAYRLKTEADAAKALAAGHNKRMRDIDPAYKSPAEIVEAEAAAEAARVAAAAAPAAGKGPPLWAVGAGGLALGAGGIALGNQAGKASATEEANANNNRNKWLSYGGGMATGLAAPSILKGLNSFVSNQGLLPSGGYDQYGGSSDFTDI